MLRFVLFLIFTIAAYQPASAAVVRVANGDCAGLSSAVAAATQQTNPASSTTILLARNGTYSGCAVQMSVGNVAIDGQGALMQFFSACIGAYLPANDIASLTLRNMTIGSAITNSTQLLCADGGVGNLDSLPTYVAIYNVGSLSLEGVTLQGLNNPLENNSIGYYGNFYTGFIDSNGSLTLRNVTVANVNQQTDEWYSGAFGALINSCGKLEIYNSSFINNNVTTVDNTDQVNVPLIDSCNNILIANSLFVNNASAICNTQQGFANAYPSLGGNVSTDTSCGFSAATRDVVTQNAGLGSFGNNGGLVPTQALAYGSAAHGVGVGQYCEALDARGYTRATNTCDAGAYEYGGGSGALTANGMNGVYYDPAANGHYVSIQRIHDNGDVLVIWNTFDHNGNPAWIYGVGQITDKHIHVAMSQNLGGVLQVGGPAIGSTVRAWGTVDIDLSSCLLAQFNYQSGLPEFGSGQFPLTRLAIVTDFGCSD